MTQNKKEKITKNEKPLSRVSPVQYRPRRQSRWVLADYGFGIFVLNKESLCQWQAATGCTFAVLASTAPVERVSSHSDIVLWPNQARLSDKVLSALSSEVQYVMWTVD